MFNRQPTRRTVFPSQVFPNPVAKGNYPDEVAFMNSWLTGRITYMDATYGH